MLTFEEAHRIWRYDQLTGYFFWRVKVADKVVVGSRAGSQGSYGYWQLKYNGHGYRAGRVAWLMMTGKWPNPEVDHKYGDRSDDRFANLRESTRQQQMRNRKVQSHNMTGLKGVWAKPHGKYAAYISNGKRLKYLGLFTWAVEAKAAYDAAAREMHGEFFRS